MDKKTLFALTAKIFNTLKGIGIKPKIGVTTGIKRLPGSRNSFNTDLSKLEGGNPESLKKLIANDADFLPQATSDEIIQYAKDHGISMICIATNGRGGVEHLLLGSTTERVVRKAPCPVLVIRPITTTS